MDEWKTIAEVPNYKINTDGDVVNKSTGKRLSPIRQKSGYNHVTLCDGDGQRQRSVHRLVAKAFIPNPNNLPDINHIDGNKSNNNVGNLEWCTKSENMKHAYRTGLQKPMPEQIEQSLSKAVDTLKRPVRNINTGIRYDSVIECSKKEGLSRSAVSMHLTGRIKRYRFEYAD